METLDKVKLALHRGATIGQITQGIPIGGGKRDRKLYITSSKIIKRYRQENREFDQFVVDHIRDNGIRSRKLRHQRSCNLAVREQNNDYYQIRAMLPANFPDKDAVASDIFEAILSGSLRREDVRTRVKDYVRSHNRMSPQYLKFGGSLLISLDAPLFADGTTTLGETVTRRLWD